MFRLLLDENLPTQLADLLRASGCDAVHAREAGLRSAPDEDILARAASEERICVTMDHDLHRLLAESAAETPSVMLLRHIDPVPTTTAPLVLAALQQIASHRLAAHFAATVTPRNLRLRPLPIAHQI